MIILSLCFFANTDRYILYMIESIFVSFFDFLLFLFICFKTWIWNNERQTEYLDLLRQIWVNYYLYACLWAHRASTQVCHCLSLCLAAIILVSPYDHRPTSLRSFSTVRAMLSCARLFSFSPLGLSLLQCCNHYCDLAFGWDQSYSNYGTSAPHSVVSYSQ